MDSLVGYAAFHGLSGGPSLNCQYILIGFCRHCCCRAQATKTNGEVLSRPLSPVNTRIENCSLRIHTNRLTISRGCPASTILRRRSHLKFGGKLVVKKPFQQWVCQSWHEGASSPCWVFWALLAKPATICSLTCCFHWEI